MRRAGFEPTPGASATVGCERAAGRENRGRSDRRHDRRAYRFARKRTGRIETREPDEALKLAIKAALDAGDLARVSAWVEVFKATSMPTHAASNVIDLDPERQRGRR